MTDGDAAADHTRLSARSVEDLMVVAALLQDAIVPVGDIAFQPDEGSFVLAVSRFRWEADERTPEHERVHAGLRFDAVRRVTYRGIDLGDRARFLSLLTLSYDDGIVALHFSGGGQIRLDVDALNVALEDFGEPWPVFAVPMHDSDD
jgi:Protein of unknown function (DUF2948)